MFNYFLRHKHGSISVMLAILLIAVLSLNSSMLEIAKYKSTERLYRELTENAAFSLLGYYDRDLYKDFGLLAIEQDAGIEEFKKYLENNLNGLVDMPQNISVDKLYDLTQEDVLRTQIMEFTAYRAPISMVNNTLNIEDIMEQLIEEIKNALPIFEMFLELLDVIEHLVEAVDKLDKYGKASKTLNEEIQQYNGVIQAYNQEIERKEQYMEEYKEQQEKANEEEDGDDSNQISPETYEQNLANHDSLIAGYAATLQTELTEVAKALGEQQKAYDEFLESYEKVQTGAIIATLNATEAKVDAGTGSKQEKEDTKAIIHALEDGAKKADNIFQEVVRQMEGRREANTLEMQTKLSNQKDKITQMQGSNNYERIEDVGIRTADWLSLAIEIGLRNADLAYRMVQGFLETIGIVGNMLGVFSLFATGGIFDLNYTSTIKTDIWNSLPGQKNRSQLNPTSNPYAQEDTQTVQEQLAKTEGAAAATGFDLGIFNQTDGQSDTALLRNAIDRFMTAEYRLREELSGLSSIVAVMGQGLDIINRIIEDATEFVSSFINLGKVFIQLGGNPQLILQYMYEGVYAAAYANDMFSNRTTKDGDKKMNGSSFSGTSRSFTNETFTMANVEYIIEGSNSESFNQMEVFRMMLMIRMLCNIPAVVTNQKAMDVISKCPEPISLVIVAIIVICGLFLMESWMDMIVMLYGGGEVDIIKLKGYFTFDQEGTKRLIEELKKLINVLGTDSGKKTIEQYVNDYTEGLLKWTYKDHLFLLMLLSVPQRVIYARCADLIEMQMKQKKKLEGNLDGFELENMATYIRVESEAEYKPLLPIPVIPGINDKGIKIKNMYYSGY